MQHLLSRSTSGWWFVAVAIIIATLPSGGHPPDGPQETLRQLQDQARRIATARSDAQVRDLASRYRRPAPAVSRIVAAAERAADQHGLPASLLLAMAETESGLDPAARSRYGAIGLMQIVPRHHPKVVQAVGGRDQLWDAEVSVAAGATILADYVAQSGNLNDALDRYSGGALDYARRVLERKLLLDLLAADAARPHEAAIGWTARTRQPPAAVRHGPLTPAPVEAAALRRSVAARDG
jgi:soluble lytic murein transglycosylase-like protein